MLVSTIAFEIRDFKNGIAKSFIVEANQANYEMICNHRYTREIKLQDMFDFEFAQKEHNPLFLMLGRAVADSLVKNETSLDIDDVDEMVGVY